MTRPAGVTASAVVCGLGGGFTLLMGAMMVFAMTLPGQPVAGFKPVIVGVAVVFVGLSGLGFWTAVGLFRLRSWARVSILVFAGFLTATCVFLAVVMAFVPLPPPASGKLENATLLRSALVMVYLVPAVIGVWWLTYFNRQATNAAFTSPGAIEASARPLSISIIGWWSLVSGVLCVFPAAARLPAFFLGSIFTGWSAAIFYLVMGGVSTWIGWRLLKLDERGRVAAIVWYCLSSAHVAFVLLVPGQYARMLELQSSLRPQLGADPPIDPRNITFAIMSLTMPLLLAAIWFLVKARPALAGAAAHMERQAL